MKKKIIVLFIALTFILTVSCTQTPQKKDMVKGTKESSIFETGEIEKIKITSPQANVRSGCSNNFPTIKTLNKNDKVDVVGKVRDWYVVRLPDNKLGSIPANEAKPIVEEEKEPEKPITQSDKNKEANNDYGLNSQEKEMVNLINQERKKNNLPALKIDSELTKVARIKSQDMIDNNYFSHNSPTYGSPFDMMKRFGIKYTYAGENIAANTSVRKAHDALMGSSGHRKNILNPNFTHIGIGIKKGGRSTYTITQMFIGK